MQIANLLASLMAKSLWQQQQQQNTRDATAIESGAHKTTNYLYFDRMQRARGNRTWEFLEGAASGLNELELQRASESCSDFALGRIVAAIYAIA